MTNLGETLKKLRFKKGMTQGDLANAININKANISNYERGYRNPPYAVLCAIAEVLDTEIDELLACVVPDESSIEGTAKEDKVDSIRQRRIKRLLAAFDKLSDDAQLTAIERIEELGMIPAYRRQLADILQQYVYNRCRIKMQVAEEPLVSDSCETDNSGCELRWKAKHIALQNNVEGKYAPCWDFYYFPSGSDENEVMNRKDDALQILKRVHGYNDASNETVFVFDDGDMFNNCYESYSAHYDGPAFEETGAPESAWALFLLVDKDTWAIRQEQEYKPD